MNKPEAMMGIQIDRRVTGRRRDLRTGVMIRAKPQSVRTVATTAATRPKLLDHPGLGPDLQPGGAAMMAKSKSE